ncbi:MAG TPA: Hsp20/alpha crystallin family protein [bacterium]|nr:Hsp20/alpha crystallin family protein [bacterium]
MNLSSYNPWMDFDSLHRAIDELFNQFSDRPTSDVEEISTGYPPADIKETKDNFFITAELPGLRREDVKISMSDKTVTISGEKKADAAKEEERRHRSERMYGTFQRSFSIPANIDQNHIKANFKDGVLTIKLPKTEESKPKQIAISVS